MSDELSRAARLDWLLSRLRSRGRIDVHAVADRLHVAPETIRRDLRSLEDDGQLQRVHGGAVPLEPPTSAVTAPVGPDHGFGSLLRQRIGTVDTLLIGSGWAGECLARAIEAAPPERGRLTVLTRSVDAAIVLSRAPNVEVFNLGGTVTAGGHIQHGDWALSELRRFRVDLAVLCPAGVEAERGLSAAPATAAAMAQAEVAAAGRLLVVADARSLGRSAFVSYAPITAVDELVVPAQPPELKAELEAIAARDVRVTRLPGVPPAAG